MEVRERILEAALSLLAESGAHELTQPRVSKAAGVRQSHLTYYFPTRADLLVAVARHGMEILAGPLLDQAQRGDPCADARDPHRRAHRPAPHPGGTGPHRRSRRRPAGARSAARAAQN